jgi:transposase
MLGVDLQRVRLFVRQGPTDMRKQINGLALIVEQQLGLDPFSESLFLFCNRERRILKALYWHRNGFCLWQKRLEKHRFPWPVGSEEAHREIDAEKLSMLLEGIDFWHAHETLTYTQLG